jgi:hypothetical protein
MSYYMRFIATDGKPIALAELEAGLKTVDPGYSLSEGILRFEGEIFGEVDLNLPGDGLFETEIENLREFLDEVEDGDRSRVEKTLRNAKAIVAVTPIHGAREEEATSEAIDPLWDWLFDHHTGLLQIDLEGYYDAQGELIYEAE